MPSNLSLLKTAQRVGASVLLGLLLGSAGCSDTECHDKLQPGGGVAKSKACEVESQVLASDAGADSQDSGASDAENTDDVAIEDGDTTTPDVNVPDTETPDMPSAGEDALLASWVSAGEDLAPLLQGGQFEISEVVVTFRAADYEGGTRIGDGTFFPYEGTWTVDTGTSPWTIRLTQSSPQALVSEGIIELFEEDGVPSMRLEIVQVEPPTPGFQPPTGGFGTTVGVEDPADNIQIYRKTN